MSTLPNVLPAGYTALADADRDAILGIGKEFRASYAKAAEEQKATGLMASETAEKLGKLTAEMGAFHAKNDEIRAGMAAIEGKISQSPLFMVPAKSLGQIVIADSGLLAFAKGGKGGCVVSVKHTLPEIILGTKDITGLSRMMPQNVESIAAGPRLIMGVRSLVPQATTGAGSVRFIKELTFTNSAAAVAEGLPKPKSDKTFQALTLPVETIAHYFKVSKQTFEDLPMLAGMIENNGIYGVQLKEDALLLNGDAVSPNLDGFMRNAVAAPAPADPGVGAPALNLIDAMGMAFFDLAARGYLPDGSVVSPIDWGNVALAKGSTGAYLFANPLAYGGTTATVWGTRLVMSSNMAPGNFLMGAFRGNSQIFDREDVTVQVANQNEDDFTHNMYTVLVEERLVLAIYQPGAFEKGIVPVPVP